MCLRLDLLSQVPGVGFWWLTTWSTEMRAAMSTLPGPTWPGVSYPVEHAGRSARRWWKLVALEEWLEHSPAITAIAWCDDHLRNPAHRQAARRSFQARALDHALFGPRTAVGLTPADLDSLEAWLLPRLPRA